MLSAAEYQDLLYDDFSFVEAHPARVLALARIFGLNPDLDRPLRVLDVGCALGGHLLPLGEQMPDWELVGIDLSEPQIERAREVARITGIRADLRVADVREVPADLGRFDVIICHGVWSWIPEDARAAVFSLFRRHLAPEGVAYVSYNAMPGWAIRGVFRQVLTRIIPPGTDREMASAAREVLATWRAAIGDSVDPMRRALASEIDNNRHQSDAYLRYEHLAAVNHPAWFSDVAEQAWASGLAYLCDAVPSAHLPFGDPEVEAVVQGRGSTFVEREALRDIFVNRLFRRDLYVHRERFLDRDPPWRRLRGMWLASRSLEETEDVPEGSRRFKHPQGGWVEVVEPMMIRAMEVLGARWPNALQIDDLLTTCLGPEATNQDRSRLGACLIEAVVQGLVECWTHYPAIATVHDLDAGRLPTPRVGALARWQARYAETCANLRHERVALGNADRALLARMDGSSNLQALRAAFHEDAAAERFLVELEGASTTEREIIDQVFDVVLRRLVQACVVPAPD